MRSLVHWFSALVFLGFAGGRANADLVLPDSVTSTLAYTSYHYTVTNLPFQFFEQSVGVLTENTLVLPQSDPDRGVALVVKVTFQGQAFGYYDFVNSGPDTVEVTRNVKAAVTLTDMPAFAPGSLGVENTTLLATQVVPPGGEVFAPGEVDICLYAMASAPPQICPHMWAPGVSG
jgi:hypothetical protein